MLLDSPGAGASCPPCALVVKRKHLEIDGVVSTRELALCLAQLDVRLTFARVGLMPCAEYD
jgi:hypothetical protein